MKKLWIPFLAVILGLHLHADPLQDKVKAFNAALKAASPASPENPMLAGRMIMDGETSMSGGEAQMEAMVQQIMATNPSESVRQAGEALLAEIRARRKARVDALITKVDAVLDRVPGAVAKSQKPEDLDAILDDLLTVTPIGEGGYGNDAGAQAQINRVNQTYQFVTQWQDYLSHRVTGNTQQALESLRNLLNSRPPSKSIVARSEILAQIDTLQGQIKPIGPANHVPDLAPILDGVKTLDDLAPAAHQLSAEIGFGMTYDLSQLNQLAFLYGEAKNGLSISLDTTPTQFGMGTPHPGFARIEAMLFAYLLPRYLGASAPAMNANETVRDYLDRVVAAAEAAQDWALLQRAMTAQGKVSRQMLPNGTLNFLTGLNQEMGGEYSMAVSSYESALRSPDAIPTKLISDHLAAIKKDHASEYEDGMKNFLRPPTPTYPSYIYGPRYGMPGFMPPNAPGVPAPAPNPTPASATPAANPVKTSAPTPPSTNVPPAVPPALGK